MKKLPTPLFALACILSVLAVVGVIAGAAEASRQPSGLTVPPAQPGATATPIPTATPTPGPPQLTPVEFEEFVGSLCNNSQVWQVDWEQLEDGRLHLFWEVDKYQGPHTGLPYDGYELAFRIERIAEQELVNRDYDSAPWEPVADVTNETWWKGQAGSGTWIYRVAPFSVTHQGQTMRCPDLAWNDTYVSIFVPPTAEELAKLARNLCEDLEVVNLEGYGDWDEVWLYWDTSAHDLPALQESHFNYLAHFYEEVLEPLTK